MRALTLTVPLVIIIALVIPVAAPHLTAVHAQDNNPNPAILICATDAGCWHSEKSGEITGEQMGLLLGDDPHGENTVVCMTDSGCDWSALSPEEAELTLSGGEGGPDGERKPALENPEDSDMLFPAVDVEEPRIVPVAGTWTSHNLAGVMDCGVVTLDVPPSPPESGELIVVDDGTTLTLESGNPELGVVPMQRVQDGVYYAQLELAADGGTMTLDFYEVFVANTMAFGMIHGEITQQGMQCTILRPFYATVEGLELLEAGTGQPSEDDTDSGTNSESD